MMNFKKFFLAVLIATLLFPSVVNANIADELLKDNFYNLDSEYDSILDQLTYEDFENAYNILQTYDLQSMSSDELDYETKKILIDLHKSTIQLNRYLPESYSHLKNAEKALVKKHPFMASVVYDSSKKASRRALELYNTKTHNDNGDAFRHAYWNALLSCKLSVVYTGKDIIFDLNRGLSLAEKFATAHEDDPNQPKEEELMDLYNNRQGRIVYRDYFNPSKMPSDMDLSNWVENRVDRGIMRKLDPTNTYLIATDNRNKR